MRYTLRDGVLFACAASILILSYSLQPTSVIGRDLHTSLSGGSDAGRGKERERKFPNGFLNHRVTSFFSFQQIKKIPLLLL